VDYVVGKIQCDLIQRKVAVLDLLGEHDTAVAIIASERSGSVGAYGELPDLKFLGGNSLVVGLNDRDFVQKPILILEVVPVRLDKTSELNENRMKNLPLWPFLAFRTIVESVSCTESMSDWGTNPPPRNQL
jgi:hypothetical protein